jgi:hypothetical protein
MTRYVIAVLARTEDSSAALQIYYMHVVSS